MILIAPICLLEYVLLQFMRIKHILLFLLDLILIPQMGLIHNSDLIVLIAVDKLLLPICNSNFWYFCVAPSNCSSMIYLFNQLLPTSHNYNFLGMINLRSVNALRGLLRFTQMQTFASPLVANNYFAFAFMQLFERNKRPQELDPIFKRETKMKGHIKSKAIKVHSPKLNENPRKQKQKLKNHKGLLKRIKIVGPRWNRMFKFQSPGSRHLHRHKSRANLIRKRRTRYVHKADMDKVKKLVPYFKRKSLKQRY